MSILPLPIPSEKADKVGRRLGRIAALSTKAAITAARVVVDTARAAALAAGAAVEEFKAEMAKDSSDTGNGDSA